MSSTSPISLWDASAEESAAYPNLDGDASTDVAIVGGGFTGLSTALHSAERGVECHVLEAQAIGYGGSGRNAGLVNAGLWLPPQDVRERVGTTHGNRFLQVLSDAPEYVHSLIEKHQIRCESTRSGTIHAAHSAAGFRDLERRAQEWQRMEAPVELLSREQATDLIGTATFHGGLLDRRAGTINPMGYVRGLARAAHNAGATISVGVSVKKLERDGSRWRVITDRGTVTAKRVVLGTNAYSDDLWPGLNRTFTKIHYFQLATRPLGERGAHILKGRQGLWTTHPVMFSIRRDMHGRLLVGSMGKTLGGLSERWARKRIAHLFPALGPVEIENAWFGQIAMTPNHLPRIHRLADGLYTPIGYNGRGITPGTVFGRALGELLAGGREEDLPLPITAPAPVANGRLKSRFYGLAFSANQLFKSL